MISTKDKSLEALRQILLRDDLIKLAKLEADLLDLQQRISDKESLIVALEPIITNLLERKIAVSRDEMAAALAPVMSEAIRLQIAEAKEDVIDALYPVIGKVIRKSVAEAMKKFIESVNQKIEQTLKSRLFRKRIQSKLTGVSEGELMIKDALPFKIEEMFLIHRESGVLISHVSSKAPEVTVDQELISGMLTAIRDFIDEAFSAAREIDMDIIQYGDNKILVEMGHHFYLAIVISGFEPTSFHDEVRQLGTRIHNRFYKFFRDFNGELTKVGEITKSMARFYEKHLARTTPAVVPKPRPYLLYLLLGLLIIALAFWGIQKIPTFLEQRQLKKTIVEQFSAVAQLRQQQLNYRLSNGWLIVTGNVPSAYHIMLIDSVARELQGLSGYQNRVLVKDQAAFQAAIIDHIQQQINQNPHWRNLTPRLIIEDDQVIIEGEVPNLSTRRELGFMVSEIPGVHTVINNLTIRREMPFVLEEARQFLQQHTVFFRVNDTTISAPELEKLNALLEYIKEWRNTRLIVTGYSDNSATPDYNLVLSEQRARAVANYLTSRDYPPNQIIIRYFGDKNPIASNETEEGRAKNRRVEFDIEKER